MEMWLTRLTELYTHLLSRGLLHCWIFVVMVSAFETKHCWKIMRIRLLCYALFFFCYLLSLLYDVVYIPNKWNWLYMYWKRLMMGNMVLLSLYYGVCFVRAIIDYFAEIPDRYPDQPHPGAPTYYSLSIFHTFCDHLYTRLAFPLSLLVVLMFWGLYAIDRELVYPEHLDKIIPQWLNHVMHMAPVLFILIDSLLICHKYPSRWEGARSVVGYGILYEIFLVVWYLIEDEWAYPILDLLDNFHRALFFIGVMGFLLMLYFVGYLLNTMVWGSASHRPTTLPQPATVPKKFQKAS